MAIHRHPVRSGEEIKLLLHSVTSDLTKKKNKSLTHLNLCLYFLKAATLEFCGITYSPCTWSVSTTTDTAHSTFSSQMPYYKSGNFCCRIDGHPYFTKERTFEDIEKRNSLFCK